MVDASTVVLAFVDSSPGGGGVGEPLPGLPERKLRMCEKKPAPGPGRGGVEVPFSRSLSCGVEDAIMCGGGGGRRSGVVEASAGR